MSESIWDDPRITNYVLGAMSEEDRIDFETEIESNSELAAAIEEARTVTDQLASLYLDESIPSLDHDRRASIVSGELASRPTERKRTWPRLAMVLAMAAALLLMIGLIPGLYLRQQVEKAAMLPQNVELRTKSASAQVPEVVPPVLEARVELEDLGEAISPDGTHVLSMEQLARGEEGARVWYPQNLAPQDASAKPSVAVVPLQTELEDIRFGDANASSLHRSWELNRAAPTVTDSRQGVDTVVRGRASLSVATDFGVAGVAPEHLGQVVVTGPQPASAQPVITRAVDAKAMAEGEEYRWGLAGSQQSLAQSLKRESVVSESKDAPLSFYATDLRFGRRGGEADFSLPIDEGRGPGVAGDRFDPITDNPFQRVLEQPLSTFSVDVDTASYSKMRDYLTRANQLPRPDAVRVEELLNYFSYSYRPPADSEEHPFAARVSVTSCPWNDQHRLARIALKGKTMEPEDRPPCNLVFLLDTSGSMNAPNKLPLVIEGMQMLVKQLADDDKVAITVYAGSAGLVLDSTAVKKEKKIRKALTQLSAGGSTNGGAGIALAYQTARDNFISEGVNRVILCTDGDFNVGTTGTDELVRMVETEAKGGIFLSVLGFGMGNHNDAMLEQISGRGNGNYAFIDSKQEARKVLVEQTSGTLVTIAKDVKLQIEFNPSQVSSYRLIGYENRVLAKEDFNDDKKDAGEIGAGHSVTALYEIVPAGVDADANPPKVDDLKYQQPPQPSDAAESKELLTLKLRYKEPDEDTSKLVEFPVEDEGDSFADADDDVRFAAAVASFGMQLRRSPYAGSWTLSDAMNTANRAKGEDRDGLRAEFVTLVQKASQLMGEE